MLNRTKKLFYTTICKTKDKVKRYSCMRKQVNIDPYETPYKDIIIQPIFKDVVIFTDYIESILQIDISKKTTISKIDTSDLPDMSLLTFFTDNSKLIIDRDAALKYFITVVIDLQELYDDNYKRVTEPIVYRNCLLIKPYLNNATTILDNILDMVNELRRYK